MPNIPDPVADFLAWYGRQDREVQTDLAAFVLVAAKIKFDHATPSSGLVSWMPGQATGLELLGRIGLLRTVVEVCFARQRARPEFWATGATLNAVLGAQVRSKGMEDFADSLSTLNSGMQKRQELWAAACASWSALTASSWSDAQLELWIDDAMRDAQR